MSNKLQVGDILYDCEFRTFSFGIIVEIVEVYEEEKKISVVWFENPNISLYRNVYIDSNVLFEKEYNKSMVKYNAE